MDSQVRDTREKVLLIVATNFPYINGEPYLEDELKIIAPKISKIVIALPEGIRNQDLPMQMPFRPM